jgi:hypothetical protein
MCAERTTEPGSRNVSSSDSAKRAMTRHAEHAAHDGHECPMRIACHIENIFDRREA